MRKPLARLQKKQTSPRIAPRPINKLRQDHQPGAVTRQSAGDNVEVFPARWASVAPGLAASASTAAARSLSSYRQLVITDRSLARHLSSPSYLPLLSRSSFEGIRALSMRSAQSTTMATTMMAILKKKKSRLTTKTQPLSRRRRGRRGSFTTPGTSASPSSWRQRYFRSKVWLQALETLSILLLNTSLCILCIWVSTLCFSRGNVFSGQSPSEQSDFEFLLGTSISTHTFFYWIFVAAHSPVLMPLGFAVLTKKKQRTTFLFCVQRLARHTFAVYLASLAVLVGFIVLLYSSSNANVASLRKQHLEFYVGTMCVHCYNADLGIALRRIFRGETMLGLSRARVSSFRHHATCWKSSSYYLKIWVRILPLALAVMLAGLYVQLTSGYRVHGGWDFLYYTLGSLAIKNAVKEFAKIGIVRLNVQDPRTIFIVVGLPTVLIDTQMRIMLQRVQSTKYTLLWTFGMAVLEVATRWSKVLWMKHKLQQRRESSSAVVHVAVGTTSMASQGGSGGNLNLGSAATVAKQFGSLRDETRAMQWKIQMVAFQIAESYANMSAEYLAIGCSTCILYFYWDHPKYDLGGFQSTITINASTTSTNAQHSSWFQGSTLLLQVAVEIAVDYVSCVLEIGEGIDFHEVRRYRVFLMLLFICIAAVNIHICVLIYLNVQ